MGSSSKNKTAYGELVELPTKGVMRGLAEEDSSVLRFLQPQRMWYARALAEVAAGRKQGHWIWYVFPQMRGLGVSPLGHYYGLNGVADAVDYLCHPVLGARYREMVAALLQHAGKKTAEEVFGALDALKVWSSLTLFERAGEASCGVALAAFYGGERDARTLALL